MCPDDPHAREIAPYVSEDSVLARERAFGHAQAQFSLNALKERPRIRSPFGRGVEATDVIRGNGWWQEARAYTEAEAAIQSMARQLGHGDGTPLAPVAEVPGGFVGRYDGRDIYYSASTGAHEVHGDIKAKYDALAGPAGLLGLPVTDEQGTPTRGGRFNHFVHGSIYWTASTGPMAVRGGVRDVWAASGWELGLGFPVQDQYRLHPYAPDVPPVEWCFFENGVIAADTKGKAEAAYAELSAADITAFVGATFNAQFQASPDNVALRPGIAMTAVSNYAYGFWRSAPRTVSFSFQGFHDNGLWTDTDFIVDISLAFDLVTYPTFTEPTTKSLVASLEYLRVRAVPGFDGLAPTLQSEVKAGVTKAIHAAFFPDPWPNPDHPEVPYGSIFIDNLPTGADPRTGNIDLLGVYVTADGALRFALSPLAPPFAPPSTTNWGLLRKILADTRLSPFRT